MLKRIVEKINSKTTKTDIFGRYGGDEFMIILKDKDIEAATSLAEEIRDVVNNETYAVGEDNIKITISQGISLLNNEVKVVDNIRHVDMAMIKAKNEEPGKIVVAGDA